MPRNGCFPMKIPLEKPSISKIILIGLARFCAICRKTPVWPDVDILVSSIGAWTILGSATKAGAPLMLSVGDMATFVKVPAGELAMLGAVQRAADRQAEVLMRRLLSSAGAQTGGATSFAHKAVPIRQPDMAVAIGSAPDPRRLDPAKLVVLSILAITVLIAASLNASNLTMSQMLEKAPTIAVRRAFGAGRAQVAQSVLSGGMLLFVIAAIIGCIFAAILSDPFGSILGRPVDSVLDAAGLITIALLAIVIGLASAAYPAFAASRFKTSAVLSSRWANIPGASIIRVVLVALQVGASAAIILFAAAVYQQLSFLTKADLGFNNRSAVAFVLPEPVFPDDPRSSTLRALGGEDESVSLTAVLPSEGSMGRLGLQTSAGQIIEASSASIDPAYFDVLDARLLAGQGFTLTDLGSEDSGAAQPVILSANLTSALGFTSPYEAIGQILRVPDESRTLMIKAVAPNLPLGAIRDQKRPFAVYEPARRPATYLLAPSAEIASDVQRVFPGQPLESIALAQRARNAYLDLTRIRWIAALFALLALITASVGIYALAVNRAANMRVEAGVRKAFGARNWSIALLLLRRLTPAITVGILLGLVAGGVVTLRWLSGFSRQAADLPIAAIIATLAILILFVFASAGQAFRLARSNPVKTLRDTA